MYWPWIAGLIAGVILFDVAVRLYSAWLILRIFDKQLALRVAPSEPSTDAQRIAFPTADGLTLRGSLHRSEAGFAKGLIVFCPELNGSHWSAKNYCRGLIENGFDVLSFDFRNQGESDTLEGYEPLHWVTNHEVADVEAALRFSRSRDDLSELPIGLMGVSRGGGAALSAAAQDSGVERVSVEGAFPTEAMHLYYTVRWASVYVPGWILKFVPGWHIKTTLMLCRRLSELRRRCQYVKLPRMFPRLRNRPVLLIAGEADSYVPMIVVEEMAERIGGESCELWRVCDAKHNRARHIDPDEYDDKLVAFFDAMTEGDGRHAVAGPKIARSFQTSQRREPTAST